MHMWDVQVLGVLIQLYVLWGEHFASDVVIVHILPIVTHQAMCKYIRPKNSGPYIYLCFYVSTE